MSRRSTTELHLALNIVIEIWKCFLSEEDYDDRDEGTEEDEEDEEEEGSEEDSQAPSNARPRRMSEIHISSKVKPIPPASSLFLFAPTNKWDLFTSQSQQRRNSDSDK